jgi:hypothetical protein
MKSFKRLALVVLAIAFVSTQAANADTFSYQFADGGITANGMLVATEIGNTGTYNVTQGTINVNFGNGILTGVLAPNPNVPNPYNPPCGFCGQIDDLLYPSSNAPSQFNNLLLDVHGLLFTVNGIYGYTNIWGGDNNGYGSSYSISGGWDAYGGGTFKISQTPEVGSLLLFGTGLASVLGVIRRKWMT